MISQGFTDPLFNSVRVTGQLVPLDGADSSQIALHDPYFDSVGTTGKDLFVGAAAHNHDGASAFVSEPFPPTYPPPYHRRMSADTQVSSADSTTNTGSNPAPYSSSPDHHKHTTPESKMSSLVLPPINDLHRPLSPEHSDGSASTRSPQWQHQHQHLQQHQQHHSQPSYHSVPAQYAQMPPQHQQLPFPPMDHVRPRPQLQIQPPEHHRLTPTSYPTPTTASTLNGYSTTTSNPSYNTYPSAYRSAPVQGIAQQPQQAYRPPMMTSSQTPTSQNGPITAPLLTPATLAAAVGTQPRRRGKLPKPVTEFLKKWLLAHTDHPYPTEDEKKWLCSETGLSMSQVSNWMINARRRILAPAAKANAQAAANAATAVSTVTPMGSSATATTASPYYSRSPPVRTVSGSSSDASMAMYGNGSAYAPARRDSYAPYPHPASRVTSAHHPGAHHHQQQHHQHHPHGGYSPVASSPYPSSSAPSFPSAYHFQSASTSSSTTGGASGHNPTSSLAPYSSSPFDGSPTTPGGQQLQDLDAVSERTKSPGVDFAYAPQ